MNYEARAQAFVRHLGQHKFDITNTDGREQDQTLRSKSKDDQGPGFGGSPGEGLLNGPQDIYDPVPVPAVQPTDTPELVREARAARITLRAWLRARAEVIPNSLSDLSGGNGGATEPPLELNEPLMQQQYSRPDPNLSEDTDVIMD